MSRDGGLLAAFNCPPGSKYAKLAPVVLPRPGADAGARPRFFGVCVLTVPAPPRARRGGAAAAAEATARLRPRQATAQINGIATVPLADDAPDEWKYHDVVYARPAEPGAPDYVYTLTPPDEGVVAVGYLLDVAGRRARVQLDRTADADADADAEDYGSDDGSEGRAP